jgi:hypothetical protein
MKLSTEEVVVEAVDMLLQQAQLDDECRDRVTDLIVAAFKRRSPSFLDEK